MLALVVVSCLFLRWFPRHGNFIVFLEVAVVSIAVAILATQHYRYKDSLKGIAQERLQSRLLVIMGLGSSVVMISGISILMVVTSS